MKNKLPSAILFDLDDTLVAWDMVSEQSWYKVCFLFAPRLGLETEQLFGTITRFREWYLSDWTRHRKARLNLPFYREEIVRLSLEHFGFNRDGLATSIAKAYGIEREAACYIIPGAIEVLSRCKKEGIKTALISNGMSEGQWRKIKRFDLSAYFDHIQIEEDFGLGKPEKKVFQHALEVLGVSPENTWMIGDSLEFDINGGKSVGLYCIWVDWQGKGLPPGTYFCPDLIIRSISELNTIT